MTVLLADKVHKQEPQCKWLHNVYMYIVKEQKKEILKISRRNLPTDAWMWARAAKVHKQAKESTFLNIDTFHTAIPA